MRLTHKHKYKADNKRFVFDMKDYRKACQKLGQLEDILEEFNILDLNELRIVLENERKGTDAFADWWEKRFTELLKSYKDIEKELGISLITLFKALKNGVWAIDDYTQKLQQVNIRGIELRGLCAIWSPTMPECDYILEYKDYGKTWALTKEKLE